ncbi:MAG: hypothetical protein ACTS3F_01985 [Phycisphaerales bacterium]
MAHGSWMSGVRSNAACVRCGGAGVLALGAWALAASPAHAAFVPTFQNRLTSANVLLSLPGAGEPAQDALGEEAEGFEVFSSELDAGVVLGGLSATAVAVQHTAISGLSITGDGFVDVMAPPTPPGGLASVNASSRAGISFTIDHPVEVLYSAIVTGDLETNYVLLQGPDGMLISQFGTGSVGFAGVLEPGSYFLDVSFTAAVFQSPGAGFDATSGFEFSLIAVPGPGTGASLMMCGVGALVRRQRRC